MDINTASSRSLATFPWIDVITYSNSVASQGNVRGILLHKPNSSSADLKSSMKIMLFKYTKGSTKRLSSVLYTTKWPFFVHALHPSDFKAFSWVLRHRILFLCFVACLCHFLAISMIFLVLIIFLINYL